MTSFLPAKAGPTRPPLRILMTTLHLSLLGVFGWAVLSVVLTLFGVGLGTVVIAGIGLVLLVGLAYTLFGVAWFETERVNGLYRLGIPTLRLVPAQKPGFSGYLRRIGRQSIDGRMWQSLASFFITTVLGTLTLLFLQLLTWAMLAWIASTQGEVLYPSFGIDELLERSWGPLSAGVYLTVELVSVIGIVGVALLHRLIAVWIARTGARVAELAAEAALANQQREGAVRAADLERTRIERDLHDGVQPRLVSVGMTLGLAQQQIDADPEGAKALISEAHTSTKAAITELRQLARGIHPSVLDDRGLDAALSAIASRSHVPVVLDVRLDGRCSREAETAMYFAIAESLTNAAKHSRASECRVTVRLRDGHTLWARVEDNGIGGARVLPGGGLDGIVNRVQAAGGNVRLDSPQGGPTLLEVSVPCAL